MVFGVVFRHRFLRRMSSVPPIQTNLRKQFPSVARITLFLRHCLIYIGNYSYVWSFLCTLLNRQTHKEFKNDQYQTLVDPHNLKYDIKSECTIFFEIDGPYKAMILPTSTEDGEYSCLN